MKIITKTYNVYYINCEDCKKEFQTKNKKDKYCQSCTTKRENQKQEAQRELEKQKIYDKVKFMIGATIVSITPENNIYSNGIEEIKIKTVDNKIVSLTHDPFSEDSCIEYEVK